MRSAAALPVIVSLPSPLSMRRLAPSREVVLKLSTLAVASPSKRTRPVVAVASITSMPLALEKAFRPMSTAAVPAAATIRSTTPVPPPRSMIVSYP